MIELFRVGGATGSSPVETDLPDWIVVVVVFKVVVVVRSRLLVVQGFFLLPMGSTTRATWPSQQARQNQC